MPRPDYRRIASGLDVAQITAILFALVSNVYEELGFELRMLFTARNCKRSARSSPLLAQSSKEVPMRPLMNVKHREDHYFHSHPMQGTFALVASMTLAGLIVVAILMTFAH